MPDININSRYRGSGDISMRHNDTYVGVVQRDGSVTPYRCHGASSSDSISISKVQGFQGEGDMSIGLNDDRLLLDRPQCGYATLRNVDGEKTAVYFCTRALRQYKRSLVYSHLHRTPSGNGRSVDHSDRRNLGAALFTFFNDVYSSVENAVNELKDTDAVSIAIGSKFALAKHEDKGIVLCYKRGIVGWYDLEEEQVKLVNSYQHLQEQLEEIS